MFKVNGLLVRILGRNSIKGNLKRRKTYPPHGLFEERINVPYYEGDTNPQHSFDIYYAKEKRKNCCIIDIHGGSYIMGEHQDNYPFVVPFVKEGFDAITVDYIPNNGKMDTKDLLDDCAACIKYILTHLKELNLEYNRFAITGDSAGGHLALTMTEALLDEKYAKELGWEFPKANIVACLVNCPVYDFVNIGIEGLTKSGIKRMFGKGYLVLENRQRLCPKVHIDSLTCPLFVSTCKKDFLRAQSLMLNEDMKNRPNDFVFVDIDSDDKYVGHVHNVLHPDHPHGIEVNNAMMDLIVKHLK